MLDDATDIVRDHKQVPIRATVDEEPIDRVPQRIPVDVLGARAVATAQQQAGNPHRAKSRRAVVEVPLVRVYASARTVSAVFTPPLAIPIN